MPSFRQLLRGINAKIVLIFSAAILGTIALFGAFYIMTLVVVWNLAFIASMIVWEKHKRDFPETGSIEPTFSVDERWSGLKRDIERIDVKIGKTKGGEERRALLNKKRFLENDLRRAEWSIRESNMNGIYKARTGSMRKLGERETSIKSQEGDSEEGDPTDKVTPEGALRERRRLERIAEERKTVEKIIDNAMETLKTEPRESLSAALSSLSIEFRARYNLLKRKNRRCSLADYWVAWAIISSVINGFKVESDIEKYSSEELRPKITKFIKLARSLNLPELPLLQGDGIRSSDSQLKQEKLSRNQSSDLGRKK